MKVLIVARYKEKGYAPFVAEQVAALEKVGVECVLFPMRSKGITGYAKQLPELRKVIRIEKPDVIHAHYGFCGLFANLQRKVPVVTTYHGSDINKPPAFRYSRIAMRMSAYNIFVSQKIINRAKPKGRYAIIPCGINLEDYPLIDKAGARIQLGLNPNGKYVLFAGAFDNAVKNAHLAKAVVSLLPDVVLLELKGYSRNQVALLMQAADAFLMTSLSEGSPQVIKEALAGGCPIVSVDVGDVKERVEDVDGCYISTCREPHELSQLLLKALSLHGKTNGRDKLIKDGLDNGHIAVRLQTIYCEIARIH